MTSTSDWMPTPLTVHGASIECIRKHMPGTWGRLRNGYDWQFTCKKCGERSTIKGNVDNISQYAADHWRYIHHEALTEMGDDTARTLTIWRNDTATREHAEYLIRVNHHWVPSLDYWKKKCRD